MAHGEMRSMALSLIYREGLNTGRISPARMLSLPPASELREIFLGAQDIGLLDGQGYVTPAGLAEFDLEPGETVDTQSFPFELFE